MTPMSQRENKEITRQIEEAKSVIKVPRAYSNCPNCGAARTSNLCGYCGTRS